MKRIGRTQETKRAPGNESSPVKLRYDSPDYVAPGYFLQTQRLTTYLVQRAKRGRTGLWNLLCVRWSPDEIPADATVLPLVWWKRSRTSTRIRPLFVPSIDDAHRDDVDVHEERDHDAP